MNETTEPAVVAASITPEERTEAVASIQAKTLSVAEVAKKHGITGNTVRRWVQQGTKTAKAPTAAAKERAELLRLRAENRKLRETLGGILAAQHLSKRD